MPADWRLSPLDAVAQLSLAAVAPTAFQAPALPARHVQAHSSGVQMMAKSKSLPWAEEPAHLTGMVGNAGFDPLGLSTPQNINWMREAEIKHGRMCMLAWSGYVMVDLGYTFPGAKYQGVSSFDAHDATVSYELFLLLLWVGTFETIGFSQIYGMTEGSGRAPGDFSFDPLKCLNGPKADFYKEAELQHCRLAMLAFSGVVTQSAIGHAAFPYV